MEVAEIKEYLKKHKITYEKLSKDSEIPLSTLKQVFCGRVKDPRSSTIQTILDTLGIREYKEQPKFTQEELELIELYRVAPDTWKKTAKQALALGVGEKVKQEREKKNLENFSSDKFKKTL